MKLSLVLLSVLLVLQLLSASAQSVSDGVIHLNTTQKPAPENSTQFADALLCSKHDGTWSPTPQYRQCATDLLEAKCSLSNLTLFLQKCEQDLNETMTERHSFANALAPWGEKYYKLHNDYIAHTLLLQKCEQDLNETMTEKHKYADLLLPWANRYHKLLDDYTVETKYLRHYIDVGKINSSFFALNLQTCQKELNVFKNVHQKETGILKSLTECQTTLISNITENTMHSKRIEMLETQLKEYNKTISNLNDQLLANTTKNNELLDQLLANTTKNNELLGKIATLTQQITILKNAQKQTTVNVTSPEKSMFAIVNLGNNVCCLIVVCVIIFACLIRPSCSAWEKKADTLIQSTSQKDMMNQLKNNVVKKQIQAAVYKWIAKNTKDVLKHRFVQWRLQSRQRQNTENENVTLNVFEVLMNNYRTQIIDLVREANQNLQRFCADLKIQSTPEDANVWTKLMFNKIRNIQSKIAWVDDPISQMSYHKFVQLVILKGRNVLPAVVKFQRRFLGMTKFVKEFYPVISSTIKYVEYTHKENGVTKTGMRLRNEAENSFVKVKEARTLIFNALAKVRDDLKKTRDERKEWIATLSWRFFCMLFTICLVVSVIVLAKISRYQRQ